MPVIGTAKEQWPGRTGKDDWNKHRTYTRVFEVWTDDPNDGVTVAGSATGVPDLGDSHPEDAAAVVVSVVPTQDEATPLRWTVAVEYDTQPPVRDSLQPETVSPPPPPPPPASPQTPADRKENPLDRAPIWRVGFQQTTVPATYSLFGAEIIVRNSAKLPSDPPPMVERSMPSVSVTYNTASFNFSKLVETQDAVNDAEWQKMPARTVRCIGAEANSGYENGVHFWTVTYTFLVKDATWDLKILDCGYAELIEEAASPGNGMVASMYWRKIKDPFGNEPTEPVPLDGNGLKLLPSGTPVYKTFRFYKERNFTTLFL